MSVTVGNGGVAETAVTEIGSSVFASCGSLVQLTLGNGVQGIGDNAFSDCDSLKKATIPANVTHMGSNIFSDCDIFTELTLAEGLRQIGEESFYDLDTLQTVHFCSTLETIGNSAFAYCDGLTALTVGPGVTAIGNWAFEACKNITALSLPDGLQSIGESAFKNCDGVKELVIPDSVTSLDEGAFCQCAALQKVTVGSGVQTLTAYTFQNCDALTQVTFKEGLLAVGDYCFDNCDGFNQIRLPAGTKRIGKYAFNNCDGLQYIIIPESLEIIYNAAFEDNAVFDRIYYYGSQTQWDALIVAGSNEILDTVTMYYDFPGYTPGMIENHPKSIVQKEGTQAVFQVKATGDGLSYQWEQRASESASWSQCTHTGSDTASMSVPANNLSNGMQYRCVITDGNGYVVYSETATLTAVVLKVTAQPANAYLTAGKTAQFAVKAKGTGLTYQWQYRKSAAGKWTAASATGNKTASMSVPVTAARNGYQYRCKIKDQYGNVIYSEAAVLTCVTLKFTTHPVNQNLMTGKTAKFTVKATGTELKYQWQYRTSSTGAWKNASGTGNKTATLRVVATAARNGYQYRCQITDKYGNTAYSKVATLKIVVFKVTAQPANKYLPAGKTAKFTVKASGTGLKYQWQYRTSSKGSWKAASATGNKTATLSVAATATRNGWQYRCKITDKYGNVLYSNAAALKIVTLKITTQPASVKLASGKTATFKIAAKGTELKYQWQYRTSSSGAWKKASATGNKTATLKVPVTAAKNGYQYRCKITDKYGNVLYSKAATLTVTGSSSYPKASVTDAYLRLVGNCCYHIPKINLPGNAAAEVNKRIYDDAMNLINRNSEGLGDYFGGLYYTWYQYKDIISVVMVEYWTGSEQAYAYTVSATTGKELTNAQVAQKAGYTEAKCQSLARSAAEKYYQVYSDNYTYFPSQEFSGLVASSKTASASWQYIVDNKGNLCFVGLIWTGFGKGANDYIIYQNGSTYLPYCQKH